MRPARSSAIPRPLPASGRARQALSPGAWVACLVLTFALSSSPTCLADEAGDWVPLGPPPADSTAHDLELTLRAREALLRDPTLRGSRLGVTVYHRVATLWGEVPSAEMAER